MGVPWEFRELLGVLVVSESSMGFQDISKALQGIQERYRGLRDVSWMFQEISGGFMGVPWDFMEFLGNPKVSEVSIVGISKAFQRFQKRFRAFQRSFRGIPGVLSESQRISAMFHKVSGGLLKGILGCFRSVLGVFQESQRV